MMRRAAMRASSVFALTASLVGACVQVGPSTTHQANASGAPVEPSRPAVPTPVVAHSELPTPAVGTPAGGTPQTSNGTGSLAYILDSNVWLAAPDGSAARQLTTDGHDDAYHAPSQAPDGTIYALRGTSTLVHLDRAGRPLGQPVTLATLENGAEGLAVSVDGTRLAYVTTGFGTEIDPRFGTPVGTFIYGGTDIATMDGTSVPGAALGNMLYPSWADADTLVVADGVSVYTADVGAEASPWIDTGGGCITEFDCPSGAPVSASLSASTVSRAGNIVAYVSQPYFGDEGRLFAALPAPPPATPAQGCLAVGHAAHSDPGSFSPDGTQFAFDDTRFDRDNLETVTGRGISVMTVGVAASDCGASSASLVLPGGLQPDWGSASP